MKITLWGTRGSLASPGPDTIRYGGNTSCVSVEGCEDTIIVLDAGTGIRLLGQALPAKLKRVHIFLTHLHMDHVQGLPFFGPLRSPGVEVHIWGPTSLTLSLKTRLIRYLSPPLFPVRVRDLLSELYFHELSSDTVEVGNCRITAQQVIHPNPTLGYRIQGRQAVVAYLPDHEPTLGNLHFLDDRRWTSGYALAEGADLLIHDAQYTADEYQMRNGFGHSCIQHTVRFASLAGVKQLIPFHHDPAHSDDKIDQMIAQAVDEEHPGYPIIPGKEGTFVELE